MLPGFLVAIVAFSFARNLGLKFLHRRFGARLSCGLAGNCETWRARNRAVALHMY